MDSSILTEILKTKDDYEFIETIELFTCKICMNEIQPTFGIILKNCCHIFCKNCIAKTITVATEVRIQCPNIDNYENRCKSTLDDREIRCLITEDEYLKYLQKSLTVAENLIKNSYHCKTPNCIGWVEICGRILRTFTCVTCGKINCISCKAIHEGVTCRESRLKGSKNDGKSTVFIQKLLRERKVMKCTKCGILVQKINGCNHLVCLKCKNDFQWIGKSGF